MPYFNLMDAFKEQGCSICSIVKDAAYRFMDNLLYERTNDYYFRSEVKDSLGFCPLHAWQLQKLGDCLSSTIIYRDLISSVADKIKAAKNKKGFLARFLKIEGKRDYRKAKATCPVCRITKEIEKNYISVFVNSLYEPEFYYAYQKSFGLCLPHLIKVVDDCDDNKIINLILDTESKKMRNMVKELDEIERKYDYRFSNEGFGKEGDAWIRAVEKMVGREGIF